MNKLLFYIGIALSIVFLFASIRGMAGNPTTKDLLNPIWKANGPFELSPESGRFALMYSVVENNTVFFTPDTARFTRPDVGYKDGHYVSLFAPALSFIVIPGYILGKALGISQVGTFAMISVFAILNALLLRTISLKLGANPLAAIIASILFLFATPAYAYGVNLYQHHVSTFLILASIYALLQLKTFMAMLVVFFIFGSAIPLDYPNAFFLLPISLYAGFKTFSLHKIKKKIVVKLSFFRLLTPIVVIIPLTFFLWFNNASYGSPFNMLGSSGVISVDVIDDNGKPVFDETKIKAEKEKELNKSSLPEKTGALLYFKTRNLVNGFYIHFISPDRGVLYYAPIVFFGFIGFVLAWKKRVKIVGLLVSVMLINILLYSMWGDPWGGWAFGSRYLIPSYAILSIFIALLLTYWRKNYIFLILFSVVAIYSIFVNTLGALTTSALPPKVQVLYLEELSGMVQKYTYERNWDMLVAGHSKSFVYQTFLEKYLTATQFYFILTSSITLLYVLLIVFLYINYRKKNEVT